MTTEGLIFVVIASPHGEVMKAFKFRDDAREYCHYLKNKHYFDWAKVVMVSYEDSPRPAARTEKEGI